jgi:GNAT superfamily N-acetyltransferase
VNEWPSARAEELAALVAAALPAEELSADELLACCWEDPAPSVVLASDDGAGAISASVGAHGIGFVKLVAVHPDERRRGTGRALLDAAHEWLRDSHGCTAVVAGAAAPFYLWPGVDVTHLDALCLFEAAGYHVTGSEVNMSVSTRFRADPPDGVRVVRAHDDDVVDRAMALVRREWPWWEAEVQRAIEHGCCHVALSSSSDDALGFACHSVNRAGWIGPMGTDPAQQHGGVGAALLGQLCRDLMVADYTAAEIAWVGPVRFYAKAAGATVSRSFRSLMWRA